MNRMFFRLVNWLMGNTLERLADAMVTDDE
jgi:hypothetical protein